MRKLVDRQTLIALKARRTATRVVSDFIHENRIKGDDVVCARCGGALAEGTVGQGAVYCEGCVERLQERLLQREMWYETIQRRKWERSRWRPWMARRATSDMLWIYIAIPVIVIRLATM